MRVKSKKPIVLIVSPIYPPYMGGASTYFSTLVELLRDRVDFLIYTMHCKGERKIEHQHPGKSSVRIFRTQPYLLESSRVKKYLVAPPATFMALFRFWLRYRPIIHAHSNGIFGFLPSVFSRLFRVPMLKEVQDLSNTPYNLRRGNVKRFVATGRTVAEKLKAIGIPDEKILMYPALNPPLCKRLAEEMKKKQPKSGSDGRGKIRVLFVGWLNNRVKGVDVLLEAFKIIEEKKANGEVTLKGSISLTLIGDGPDRSYCQEYIKSNRLKNIKLAGSQDYPTTLHRIGECDIVVLPSREEANPRVVLEAFQFGKPVIATRVGGTPELITNNENGLLVASESPLELANAILELAGDPELRNKLGENGKRFLESMPTWEDLADDIYKEYLSMYKI